MPCLLSLNLHKPKVVNFPSIDELFRVRLYKPSEMLCLESDIKQSFLLTHNIDLKMFI